MKTPICFLIIIGFCFKLSNAQTTANLELPEEMKTPYIKKLTTFGESHGEAIGGIIDGCPAGIIIDFEAIRTELQKE